MSNADTDLASLAAHFDLGPMPEGPRVVALGGGHGLAVALRAARLYAGDITAIVSVADDGGSSGRLRRDLDVLAPGDMRKALAALADDRSSWPSVLEHRFASGDLEGHTVGNILLVGLAEALGSWSAALAEAGRIVGAAGDVLPATLDPVVIKADVGGDEVEGQVAIQQAGREGPIRAVQLVPSDAAAPPAALQAIMEADHVLLGPGSLYTSVLAAVVVPEIRAAIALTSGRVIQIANLSTEPSETEGLEGTDHLLALLEHRIRVDTFLYDRLGPLVVNEAYVFEHGVMPVGADLADPGAPMHEPQRLATALTNLLS
jgi:uncharacterized cofD-like protein